MTMANLAPQSAGRSPTEEAYSELQKAYDLYNTHLFEGQLPGALIVMTRRKHTYGYYSPKRFANRDGIVVDEIALNQAYFAVRAVEQILSTLAHEMVHQWQEHFGNKSRRCYHDREFADKMERIGLVTTDTGYPGGRRVGEKVTHYIADEGPFIRVTRELLQSSFGIIWYDRYPDPYIMATPSASDLDALDDEGQATPGSGTESGQDIEGGEGEGKKPKKRKAAVAKAKPAELTRPAIQSLPTLASNIGLNIIEPPENGQDSGGDVEAGGTAMPTLSPRVAGVLATGTRIELPKRSGNRVKYSCPSCKDSVWGKAELSILCGRTGCDAALFVPKE